jgi:putative redox protein
MQQAQVPPGAGDRHPLTVRAPADLPAARRPALYAVVSHCTVHNSLASPPSVAIDLT